jgi:hypothetical protein
MGGYSLVSRPGALPDVPDKKERVAMLLDGVFHESALEVSESEELSKKELAEFGLDLGAALHRVGEHARSAIALRCSSLSRPGGRWGGSMGSTDDQGG